MFIKKFTSGPLETNSYIIVSSSTREAFIIDAPPGSFELIHRYQIEEEIKFQALLLTHSHWDHIADVSKIKDHYGIDVAVHHLDKRNLEEPGSDGLPCPFQFPAITPDLFLDETTSLKLGSLNFQVIFTPGHSAGSICFYEKRQRILFSGDTLFQGSIGNLSFPTSRPDLMWSSLTKLSKLPPHTQVFTGHGPSTTIENESWLANAQSHFG